MSRFYTFVLIIVICHPGCRDSVGDESPEEQLRVVAGIIESKDAKEFGARLSVKTRAELSSEQDDIEAAAVLDFANFVIERTCNELPLTIVKTTATAEERQIAFEGKTIQGTLRMVKDKGQWKIDLVESARNWKQMLNWARKVLKLSGKNVPIPDKQGGQPGFLTLPDGYDFPELNKENEELLMNNVFGPDIPGFTESRRSERQSEE